MLTEHAPLHASNDAPKWGLSQGKVNFVRRERTLGFALLINHATGISCKARQHETRQREASRGAIERVFHDPRRGLGETGVDLERLPHIPSRIKPKTDATFSKNTNSGPHLFRTEAANENQAEPVISAVAKVLANLQQKNSASRALPSRLTTLLKKGRWTRQQEAAAVKTCLKTGPKGRAGNLLGRTFWTPEIKPETSQAAQRGDVACSSGRSFAGVDNLKSYTTWPLIPRRFCLTNQKIMELRRFGAPVNRPPRGGVRVRSEIASVRFRPPDIPSGARAS